MMKLLVNDSFVGEYPDALHLIERLAALLTDGDCVQIWRAAMVPEELLRTSILKGQTTLQELREAKRSVRKR